MLVQDLIKKLQQYDPNTPVMLSDDDNDIYYSQESIWEMHLAPDSSYEDMLPGITEFTGDVIEYIPTTGDDANGTGCIVLG